MFDLLYLKGLIFLILKSQKVDIESCNFFMFENIIYEFGEKIHEKNIKTFRQERLDLCCR